MLREGRWGLTDVVAPRLKLDDAITAAAPLPALLRRQRLQRLVLGALLVWMRKLLAEAARARGATWLGAACDTPRYVLGGNPLPTLAVAAVCSVGDAQLLLAQLELGVSRLVQVYNTGRVDVGGRSDGNFAGAALRREQGFVEERFVDPLLDAIVAPVVAAGRFEKKTGGDGISADEAGAVGLCGFGRHSRGGCFCFGR